MDSKTAFILIGYQKDYFDPKGILHEVIRESTEENALLENTSRILDRAVDSEALVISTPIVFSENYAELRNPVGILRTIREVGAFKEGAPGSETIGLIQSYGSKIQEVPGKCSLNAFHETSLSAVLKAAKIGHIILMGAVTSVCIDSTARAATDFGLRVSIVSDCTAGRSSHEQGFYCNEIFPLFASVTDTKSLLE